VSTVGVGGGGGVEFSLGEGVVGVCGIDSLVGIGVSTVGVGGVGVGGVGGGGVEFSLGDGVGLSLDSTHTSS
jgi:echinoid protein